MTIAAYMLIQTTQGKLKIVSSSLKKFPEVTECHEVFGRFDIIAKIEVDDYESLKRFMQNKMLIIEGIRNTETMVVYDKVKDSNHDITDEEFEDSEEDSDSEDE